MTHLIRSGEQVRSAGLIQRIEANGRHMLFMPPPGALSTRRHCCALLVRGPSFCSAAPYGIHSFHEREQEDRRVIYRERPLPSVRGQAACSASFTPASRNCAQPASLALWYWALTMGSKNSLHQLDVHRSWSPDSWWGRALLPGIILLATFLAYVDTLVLGF